MSRLQEHDQAEQRAREKANRARQDAQVLLQTESGMRLLKHLEEKFEVGLPAWRTTELAEFAPGNCNTMAAIRDGQREVVDYLKRLGA